MLANIFQDCPVCAVQMDTDPHATIERRIQDRTRTVYRAARILTEEDEGLALLRNISDNGLSLSVALPLSEGQQLRVQLSDAIEMQGLVIWASEGKCGIEFANRIDSAHVLHQLPEHFGVGRSRPLRLQVQALATIQSETGLQAARVENISQFGLAMRSRNNFKEGMRLKVSMHDGIQCEGIVRWTRDGMAGVRLLNPLKVEMLGSAKKLEG